MNDLFNSLPRPLTSYSWNELPTTIRERSSYRNIYHSVLSKLRQHRELTPEEIAISRNAPIETREVQLRDVLHVPTGQVLKLQVPTHPTPQWLSVFQPQE